MDDPNFVPPTPRNVKNIVDKRIEQLLEEATNQWREVYDQEAELDRQRQQKYLQVALSWNWDRARAGRAQVIPVYHYLPLYDDPGEDLIYDEPSNIGSIIRAALPLGVTFKITSDMIHFLNLKGMFAVMVTINANMHLTNFIRIWTSYTTLRVDQEALHPKLL